MGQRLQLAIAFLVGWAAFPLSTPLWFRPLPVDTKVELVRLFFNYWRSVP